MQTKESRPTQLCSGLWWTRVNKKL